MMSRSTRRREPRHADIDEAIEYDQKNSLEDEADTITFYEGKIMKRERG